MRRTWRRSCPGLRIILIKRGCIKGWLESHPTKLPGSHRNRLRAYTIITGNRTAMDCSNFPSPPNLEFATYRLPNAASHLNSNATAQVVEQRSPFLDRAQYSEQLGLCIDGCLRNHRF